MNVPKLRFPAFDSEWKYYLFDDIVNIKSKSYNPNNKIEYKCIELEHINQKNGTINGFCNSIEQKSNKNFFSKGDILFGKLRPYLKKYWYATFDGVCSSEIWVAKSKNENIIINKFIYDIFQSHYFLQLCNLSTGSKMPRADWSFIKEQSVAIPSVNEQQMISDTIELLEKRIELQNNKIDKLKLFREGLVENLISKEYPLINLKKILKERKLYSEKGLEYPHVTLSKDGIYDKGDRYNRDFLVKSDDKKYKITKLNDLCYNPANLKFGVICLNEYGSAIFSPIYVTFEIDKEVNPKYIKYYTMRNNFINAVRKYEQGTVYERMSVSPEDFLRFDIKLPDRKTQDEIVNKIDLLDNKINLESKLLEELELLKKGLMQNMFV